MVFRRFSSLSRGDSDKLSASAMFNSCHKGIWAFATLLYHVVQLSGGLGQALKHSAQEFKLMSWLIKGILFASQEIRSVGFSWARGPWQKELRLEGCGKRMSEAWSFKNSEICIWCHISELNLFGGLMSWKKLKGWAEYYLQAEDCRIDIWRSRCLSFRVRHGSDLLT